MTQTANALNNHPLPTTTPIPAGSKTRRCPSIQAIFQRLFNANPLFFQLLNPKTAYLFCKRVFFGPINVIQPRPKIAVKDIPQRTFEIIVEYMDFRSLRLLEQAGIVQQKSAMKWLEKNFHYDPKKDQEILTVDQFVKRQALFAMKWVHWIPHDLRVYKTSEWQAIWRDGPREIAPELTFLNLSKLTQTELVRFYQHSLEYNKSLINERGPKLEKTLRHARQLFACVSSMREIELQEAQKVNDFFLDFVEELILDCIKYGIEGNLAAFFAMLPAKNLQAKAGRYIQIAINNSSDEDPQSIRILEIVLRHAKNHLMKNERIMAPITFLVTAAEKGSKSAKNALTSAGIHWPKEYRKLRIQFEGKRDGSQT